MGSPALLGPHLRGLWGPRCHQGPIPAASVAPQDTAWNGVPCVPIVHSLQHLGSPRSPVPPPVPSVSPVPSPPPLRVSPPRVPPVPGDPAEPGLTLPRPWAAASSGNPWPPSPGSPAQHQCHQHGNSVTSTSVTSTIAPGSPAPVSPAPVSPAPLHRGHQHQCHQHHHTGDTSTSVTSTIAPGSPAPSHWGHQHHSTGVTNTIAPVSPAPSHRCHQHHYIGVTSTIAPASPAPLNRYHQHHRTSITSTIAPASPAPSHRYHQHHRPGITSTIAPVPPAPLNRYHQHHRTGTTSTIEPAMPLLRKPPRDEDPEPGDPFAASPESRFRRRATLELLVGLGPFGRSRRGAPPGPGPGPGLGPGPGPGGDARARRRSEDLGRRRRKEEPSGTKRGSWLRLPVPTPWGQRGAGAERAGGGDGTDGAGGGDGDGAGQGTDGRGKEKEKEKEPLSVLEILELIQRRELLAADEQIIALEAECAAPSSPSSPPSSSSPPSPPSSSPSSPAPGRQARDVALLYRALLAQLWAVLAEAVAAARPLPSLRSVIRVLQQEEAADQRQGPGATGRPRRLRQRWEEAAARAAGERLAQAAPGSGAALGAELAALAARMLRDLSSVRAHVAPAFPAAYDAAAVYARGYHRALQQRLRAAAQRELGVPELYVLLEWSSGAYPREVLGNPEVGPLLQGLGPPLPPETQRSLESTCISAVKAKVEAALAQELQLSEDSWGEEVTSQELQEGLAPRVTGLLRAHVDRAPQITPEFGREMAQTLLGVLVTFLHSFQRKVERFLEAPIDPCPPDGTAGRAIALVNCCPPFRSFTERLAQFGHPEGEELRRQAQGALDKVTRSCNHVLTQRLFEDLKPYFNKLMKRKWLTSSDAFDSIVMLITSFSQKLRPLHPEPYQVLVSELHRRVLLAYVRPLLSGRLLCPSAKARARVAARLSDEARQLRELFTRLDSASPWLDSVVPRLRELLVLEDTAALQMEVGVLARDFPDVRREHVAAVLDARGLRSPSARHEILGVLRDLERGGAVTPAPLAPASPSRHRAFFAELPVPGAGRCLPFQLPRLAPMARLRRRRPRL
ncbi:exocyst complex component 3-like protein 2 [Neopsephotus bourkii]|uniref:exocyst complex component 3-like protein 2 n=1 Tax=Neopsephotus bourkii TaxID=309878 RepID=UPI002AA53978|nr:exocyst complex component 3-like protein 2 [Neopsephotus bourkii]